MPIDWSKVIQTAVATAPGAVGAVLGSRAQTGAAKENRAAAGEAYGKAEQALREGAGKAGSIYDWMLGASLPYIGQGYGQARGDLYNAFATQGNILAPYTGSGARAANEANFLLYGSGRPERFAPTLPQPPAPGSGTNMPPLTPPPGFGGAAPGAGGAGGGGGYNAFAGYAPVTTVQPSAAANIAGLAGGIGGGLAGGAIGGPLGMGIGAASGLIGNLIGHLTRGGREKEAASNEANRFSDWFWNEVKPLYDQGKIDQNTLQQTAQQGFDTYRNWLSGTLKDKNVAQNSAASQLGYFNQGLQPLGFVVR